MIFFLQRKRFSWWKGKASPLQHLSQLPGLAVTKDLSLFTVNLGKNVAYSVLSIDNASRNSMLSKWIEIM